MNVSPAPRVICLCGPTGTGKSALAISLAQRHGGVIVNADSRQVYRDFPLITAQPSATEQALCPHELYGFLETTETCAAGKWATQVLDTIRRVDKAGGLPILVGGTGLYLRALFEGMVEIPPVPEDITRRLDALFLAEGGSGLYARLQAVDKTYAARIHPNDRQRLVRSLGVFEATGRTFSWWHTQTPAPPDLRVLKLALGMTLEELLPRLSRRVDAMLETGALDEARAARLRCNAPEAPGWSGIGCAELYRHLAGELTLEQARALWIKNTRAYAKRQLTWFRADASLHWFRPENGDALLAAATKWLQE